MIRSIAPRPFEVGSRGDTSIVIDESSHLFLFQRMTAIRACTLDDLPVLLRLQAEIHPAHLLESEACFASIVAHGLSFLSLEQGEPNGYLLMHFGHHSVLGATVPSPSPDTSACIFIHDTAVTVATRGTGLGKRLAEAGLALARDKQARVVHLVALGPTVAFWTARGFHVSPSGEGADDAASYAADAIHMEMTLA
jgi:GNAT superfamily N-acetyltransferase